jgi:hypothetical protein
LLWLTGVLVAGVLVAFLSVEFPNNADKHVSAVDNKPPQVYHEPATVPLTPAARRAALSTTLIFLRTAVLRRHVGDSYALVTPELRRGYTATQWSHGTIPVSPYPAADYATARAKVVYSYANLAGLQVLIIPKRTSRLRPIIFTEELKAVGTPHHRHWLVASWAPLGSSALASGPPVKQTAPTGRTGPSNPLGSSWLLIPFALFGLIVVVPLGLGLREWIRNRRAARRYDPAERALPPLGRRTS